MTEQEQQWFGKLRDVNANLVAAHDEAKAPIEDWFADEQDLYSDTAHFIYELLQNADDAQSTEARFVLHDNELIFAHKGTDTKHFTISSLDTKDTDKGRSRYGSINALTDRNGTNKKEDNDRGNAIGKFGRGFKSVYGYTSTPRIYDDPFRFQLERYIIPVDLSAEPDYLGRDPEETLFVLPFDRPNMRGDQAVPQIRSKLMGLIMPTLFLRNLQSIWFCYGNEKGEYRKEVVRPIPYPNGDVAERIRLSFHIEGLPPGDLLTKDVKNLWVFSRTTGSGHKVSVGFFVDENESLVRPPSQMPAFCYFPTQHSTGLNFLIQAPFRLTATRENIIEETREPHNGRMIDALAELAADSIEYLRDIQDSSGHSLVSDNIVDIIPTERTTKADYKGRLDFSPFAESFLRKFQIARVIPVKSEGHVVKANAYWPGSEDISELFSESQLRNLVNNQNAGWAFATRWADRQREPDKYDFIAAITNLAESPISKCWTDHQLITKLSNGFMEIQPLDWYFRLHEWIAKDFKRRKDAEHFPIFLNQNNQPLCPYGLDNRPQLLKPSGAKCPENQKPKTVLRQFLEHEASRVLLDLYGAHAPKLLDDVEQLLDADWDTESEWDHIAVFETVFEAYCRMPEDERSEVVRRLKTKLFLAKDSAGNRVRKPCSDLYLSSEELRQYFGNADGVYYLDQAYEGSIASDFNIRWIELTNRLELASLPRTKRNHVLRATDFPEAYMSEWKKQWDQPAESRRNEQMWMELEIDCLSSKLSSLCNNTNAEDKFWASKTIWDMLRAVANFHFANGKATLDALQDELFPKGDHKYKNRGEKSQKFDNLLLFKLRTSPWLLDRAGSFKSPRELTIQELSDCYRSDDASNKLLHALFGLQNDDTTIALELLAKTYPSLDIDKIRRVIAREKDDGETDSAKQDLSLNATHSESSGGLSVSADIILPLAEELRSRLENLKEIEKPVQGASSGAEECKEAAVYGIKDFLSLNLRIPMYQRPYEWDERNVVELLDDICEAAQRKEKKYRIGSIILHVEDGVYNIVDGQQRTLTLLLVLCRLMSGGGGISDGDGNAYLQLLSSGEFYPALSQCKTSRRSLRNNLVHIDEYFRMHPGSDEAVLEALKSQLEVVVIPVKQRSEAFQLFDSQNSKGRPLEPHDLLKAFHLRLVPDKQEPADKVKTKTEMVEEWEAHDSSEIGRLFETLFRICKWNRKEKYDRFTAKDIGVFKGVPVLAETDGSEPKAKPYGYVNRAVESKQCFQIGEPFVPGGDFFAMVESYFDLIQVIDELAENIKAVKAAKNSCDSKYLDQLFAAVLLDYFDRFGTDPAANPELAIRKLCKWAFSVRLDVDYLGPKTPNKYALGNGTQSAYSNAIPMFFRIKTAVEPAEVTNIPLNTPSPRGGGDDKFSELRKTLEEL